MSLAYLQNAIINGRIAYWIKNLVYQIFYVACLIPLSVFFEQNNLKTSMQKRTIALAILGFLLLFASYFYAYFEPIVTGQLGVPISETKQLDITIKRLHVFSIKVYIFAWTLFGISRLKPVI